MTDALQTHQTPPKPAPLTGKASLIVGTLGGLALSAAAFIPPPWGLLVGWAGFIACALAGLAAHPPAFVAGKPLLQGGALTAASGALAMLAQFYPLLPAGWPHGVALGVAGLLAWASGQALPALGATHLPAPPVDAPVTPEQKQEAVDTIGSPPPQG